MSYDTLVDDFDIIDDWEDRYKYLIELGKYLPEFNSTDRISDNKVQGCVSQVWIKSTIDNSNGKEPVLHFTGDSDALIVKGLIYVLITLMSGQSVEKLMEIDTPKELQRLSLTEHLTPQRSNGLTSMISRIQQVASAATKH